MGIYEDRQFERFADEVSPLHDRETARELWADGPDEEPVEEAWVHTGRNLDWDEGGAAWVITCEGETVSLDVESVEEGPYSTGYSPGPTFKYATGHCPNCGMYIEARVLPGDALEVTSEEDEEA